MSEMISYICINCHKKITIPCEEAPRCHRCDGKVFTQLRSGNISKISTTLEQK